MQSRAPPLAMVRLRQVDQFEIKRKGPRQQNGPLHRQRMHQFERRSRMARSLVMLSPRLFVAPPDRALPQRLHMREEIHARLFAQHLAQQHAQRTNIAPQRSLLQLPRLRLQLRQPQRPTLGIPQ